MAAPKGAGCSSSADAVGDAPLSAREDEAGGVVRTAGGCDGMGAQRGPMRARLPEDAVAGGTEGPCVPVVTASGPAAAHRATRGVITRAGERTVLDIAA